MKKLITAFLFVFIIMTVESYSQDFDIVTFEGEEYFVLPNDFDPYKTSLDYLYPNYINVFSLPDGKWIAFLQNMPDKPSVTGEYRNGLAKGMWKLYSIDWTDTTSYVFLEVEYKDGKRNGAQNYYNTPANLSQTFNFKDDKYHGDFFSYGADGLILLRGQYMYGIPVGEWEYYNFDGSLMRIESYKEIIPEDSVEFYSDKTRYQQPEVLMADLFSDNMYYAIEYIPSAEGVWKEYHRNGKLSREKIYSGGLLKHVKEYYENGNIKAEGKTIAGIDYGNVPIKRNYTPGEDKQYVESGLWSYYDESGNLIKNELYKNGKPYRGEDFYKPE
ncbi:MAG: hypothetical protein KDC73_05620 [Ignavibacteriae bacterium]|nr:hypothetical protein [Ignavibacteriota bacterium]MCB9243796.1 hypothetical protein [Ignavibacteriales bacterium]